MKCCCAWFLDPDKKAITDVEQALEKGTMPQSAPECISPTSSIRDTNGRGTLYEVNGVYDIME